MHAFVNQRNLKEELSRMHALTKACIRRVFPELIETNGEHAFLLMAQELEESDIPASQ
jgi:hypothetical protein